MARRISWCHEMLNKFEIGTSRYVSSVLTGDETWLYFYDMPTEAQNKVWVCEDENMPVYVRKSRSVKKRMVAVFCTVRGVVERVVLGTQKTVTAKWYTEESLPELFRLSKTFVHAQGQTCGFSTMTVLLPNAPKSAPSICKVLG
jgi:hypothetical protein